MTKKTIDEFKKCKHFDTDIGEPVLARYDVTSGTTVQWCARCGAFKYGPEKWQKPYLVKEVAG